MSVNTAMLDQITSRIGDEYFSSGWFDIDKKHMDQFAWSTYLDEDYVDLTTSDNNPLGPELLEGFMLLSLLMYFKFKYAPRYTKGQWGFNYGLNKVRFTSPVMLGQRVRLRSTLTAAEPRGDGILVTTDNVIEVKGQDKPAMVAEWLTLWYGGNSHE